MYCHLAQKLWSQVQFKHVHRSLQILERCEREIMQIGISYFFQNKKGNSKIQRKQLPYVAPITNNYGNHEH